MYVYVCEAACVCVLVFVSVCLCECVSLYMRWCMRARVYGVANGVQSEVSGVN